MRNMENKNGISKENFKNLLAPYMEKNKLSVGKVAKAIACPEASIGRILMEVPYPSSEMLKQGAVLKEIGYDRYKKLTKSEKEKISETIGTIGGGILGFGSITAAVSAVGITGLSAVGITSGLAAIGAIVGSGMASGILVVAAIPIAAGALGFGIVKGIKALIGTAKLNTQTFEPYWEEKKN